MRIVIELDGDSAATVTSGQQATAYADMAASDGGAASGDASDSSDADRSDVGGPPDWLLKAVGAAGGDRSGANDAGGVEDAGSGPPEGVQADNEEYA